MPTAGAWRGGRTRHHGNLTSPSAVLDSADPGDIGAHWVISADEQEDQRHTCRRRLPTFLAITGRGLIGMPGDNDVGGVDTPGAASPPGGALAARESSPDAATRKVTLVPFHPRHGPRKLRIQGTNESLGTSTRPA